MIGDMLDRLGATWEYEDAVPLSEIDFEAGLRNQVRVTTKPLDHETVQRYRAALERGDLFPPVILLGRSKREGRWLVPEDANHRLTAAKELGLKAWKHGAYIVTKISVEALRALHAWVNTHHGLMSEQDRIAHAIHLVETGATQEQAAAFTGLTKSRVEVVMKLREGEDRARVLKVSPVWRKLQPSVQRAVARVSTDEGFAAAVRLAGDAHLSTQEAEDLASAARKHRSSEGQAGFLAEKREELHARIVRGRVTRRGHKRPYDMFMLNMRAVEKARPELVVADLTPEEGETLRKAMAAAVAVMHEIHNALDAPAR